MFHLSNLLTAMQSSPKFVPNIKAETLKLIQDERNFLSERCKKGLMIQYGINEINVLKAADPFNPIENPEVRV